MHIYKENFDWMLMTLPRILQQTDTTRTFTNKNGILFTVCCQQDEKKAIWWNGNAVSYMYLSLLHRTNATFTYINLILVGSRCTTEFAEYRICSMTTIVLIVWFTQTLQIGYTEVNAYINVLQTKTLYCMQ